MITEILGNSLVKFGGETVGDAVGESLVRLGEVVTVTFINAVAKATDHAFSEKRR